MFAHFCRITGYSVCNLEHLLSKLLFLVVDLTIDFYWRLVNLIVVSICTLDSLVEHIIFLRNCNHVSILLVSILLQNTGFVSGMDVLFLFVAPSFLC